jgi:hypothetical protein
VKEVNVRKQCRLGVSGGMHETSAEHTQRVTIPISKGMDAKEQIGHGEGNYLQWQVVAGGKVHGPINELWDICRLCRLVA